MPSIVIALAKEVGLSDARLYQIFQMHGVRGPFEEKDRPRLLKILEKQGKWPPAKQPTSNNKSEETKQKTATAWSNKLLPRLARLLPEGDGSRGRMRTKRILKNGGLEGRLKEEHQAQALAIFRAAGISTERFERPGNGEAKAIVVAPEQLTLVPRASPPIHIVNREEARRMQRVIILLTQYEHQLFDQIRTGRISKMCSPLELPIAALNELREALKAN